MIRIIKPGTLLTVDCMTCGAKLRYDETEDVLEETIQIYNLYPDESCNKTVRYIECPQCGEKVSLKDAYITKRKVRVEENEND